MRDRAPFRADDLAEMDERLLSRAYAVVAMQEVHAGNRHADVIGLRHDLDADHALATGVQIAEWEAARGYRATYYFLHTSPYWHFPNFRESVDRIACLGHEVGIHADALAEGMKTGRDPDVILDEALATLRGWGFTVRGVAGHGNSLCNRDRDEGAGEGTFANDEQFVECARPKEGLPDRWLKRGSVKRRIRPRPLADFGLDYEALVLGHPRPFRLSDSGGKWLNPGWNEAVDQWNASKDDKHAGSQLHFLLHPDWWGQAFIREAVAA